MHEHISAFVVFDKPKTLLLVKPFYFSLCQSYKSPFQNFVSSGSSRQKRKKPPRFLMKISEIASGYFYSINKLLHATYNPTQRQIVSCVMRLQYFHISGKHITIFFKIKLFLSIFANNISAVFFLDPVRFRNKSDRRLTPKQTLQTDSGLLSSMPPYCKKHLHLRK